MRELPPEVMKTLERIRREEQGYIEIKTIKGNYYVYRSTSEYDREQRKPVKRTSYMGRIMPDGTYIQKKHRAIQESSREIFEYGNCILAHHFLRDAESILQPLTPYHQEIIASAIIKAIDPEPIRLHSSRWEKFYLSKLMEVNLSPKHLSMVMSNIGEQVSLWHELFSSLITGNDFLLYDLTAISTYSQSIKLAEKGYNADHEYIDQIGVVMAFSTGDKLPVGVEVYYGSIKDISTIRDFLDRYPQRKIGFIFDRGFSSYDLLDQFRADELSYIVPLRKDSRYIELRWLRWRGTFLYRKRPVRWGKRQTDHGYLYLFDDPELRGEEESALLKKVELERIDMKEFERKKRAAGIIGILSDMDLDGPEMFDLYKSREDVELAFDAMKNAMDSDKVYLHSAEATRGYFFITFLAMRVYFSILKRLRERKLTSKISVDEVLFELSKVMLIREKDGREYFAKIPKRAHRMLSLFPEALHMG